MKERVFNLVYKYDELGKKQRPGYVMLDLNESSNRNSFEYCFKTGNISVNWINGLFVYCNKCVQVLTRMSCK